LGAAAGAPPSRAGLPAFGGVALGAEGLADGAFAGAGVLSAGFFGAAGFDAGAASCACARPADASIAAMEVAATARRVRLSQVLWCRLGMANLRGAGAVRRRNRERIFLRSAGRAIVTEIARRWKSRAVLASRPD
jgi:hypothetical protein